MRNSISFLSQFLPPLPFFWYKSPVTLIPLALSVSCSCKYFDQSGQRKGIHLSQWEATTNGTQPMGGWETSFGAFSPLFPLSLSCIIIKGELNGMCKFSVFLYVCVCVTVWWCVIKTISFKKIKAAVLLKANGWRERGGVVWKKENYFPRLFCCSMPNFIKLGWLDQWNFCILGRGLVFPPTGTAHWILTKTFPFYQALIHTNTHTEKK